MSNDRGKKPVVIIVEGERYVLQEPCTNCGGGEFGVYDPTASRLVGQCRKCNNGLVDTPLYTAIKKHLGIIDELPGEWKGAAIYGFASPAMNIELMAVQEPLHFYPDDWMNDRQYSYALCCQGEFVEKTSTKDPAEGGSRVCLNCLRIKTAREQGDPLIYEELPRR